MHGLETDGVNVFQNFACSLHGSLLLVSGLCWEHSSAATYHNLTSLPRSRCFLWRHFCSLRLSFQVLLHAFGLTPLPEHIYCQGEYEVRDDVPVVARGWPEFYHHLRPLHQTLGKLLWLLFQHGCGGLT